MNIIAIIFSVTVIWTSPADKEMGRAAQYDMRHSNDSTILVSNWSSGLAVAGLPVPSDSGMVDSVTFEITAPIGQEIFLAIKSVDSSGNWSGISNIASFMIEDVTPPRIILDLRVRQ